MVMIWNGLPRLENPASSDLEPSSWHGGETMVEPSCSTQHQPTIGEIMGTSWNVMAKLGAKHRSHRDGVTPGGTPLFGRMVGVFAGFFIGFPGFWIGFCLPNEIPGCPMLSCDPADIFTLDRHPTQPLRHLAALLGSVKAGAHEDAQRWIPSILGERETPKRAAWNFDTTGMSIVCHPRGVPLLRWPLCWRHHEYRKNIRYPPQISFIQNNQEYQDT